MTWRDIQLDYGVTHGVFSDSRVPTMAREVHNSETLIARTKIDERHTVLYGRKHSPCSYNRTPSDDSVLSGGCDTALTMTTNLVVGSSVHPLLTIVYGHVLLPSLEDLELCTRQTDSAVHFSKTLEHAYSKSRIKPETYA